MNCANHPETEATAFCRECGKPMCKECECPAQGSVFCSDHVPAQAPALAQAPPPRDRFVNAPYVDSPYSMPDMPVTELHRRLPATSPNLGNPGTPPALAFILGFIPGVGAICNGQYAKGLIHAVVFGLLITIANNSHSGSVAAFAGIMIAVWVFYNAFEAFHTARRRQMGVAVEEFSSLFEVQTNSKFPMGAILLIGAGTVLLLDSTDVISLERFVRFWPALLIAVGVYMLYARLNPGTAKDSNVEVGR